MANENQIAYAAGILPYAVYNGRVVFLLGKDAQDALWSDFGGKYETKDKNEIETAMREMTEETCGCVMDMRALRMRMSFHCNYHMLQSTTQSKHPYYMYLLQVPFDPHLRSAFKKTVAFLRYSKLPKGMVEKVDVQWVTLEQMQRMTLRSVFHSSVMRHYQFLESL